MKHVTILLAALVVVLGVHSFTRADAPTGVQKWEYKAISVESRLIEALGDRETLDSVKKSLKGRKLPTDAEWLAEYQRHDKNKDGALSEGDGPDWGGIGAENGENFDADSDGKVTFDEYVTGARLRVTYPLMDQDVVRAGIEGWELVSTGLTGRGVLFVFKRPLR